jgi:two-component system, sensor histidine kinase and response regulator
MMARMMEDEMLVNIVIDSFLEDIPNQIIGLKNFLETADISGVNRQAHTIKGASANIGAETMRQVAFEMEKAAGEGELTVAGGYLPELEKQFEMLKAEIGRQAG